MILVTGSTGQLGSLVVAALAQRVAADQIVAGVRSPEKAKQLAAQGVQVREADYNRPETLDKAMAGISRVLLISSNEIGQRAPQHLRVIEAARKAGVGLLAYTSVLHADSSPLLLADEHKATEQALKQSGVPWVLLRNGWYTENLTAGLPEVIKQGAMIGASKQGRFAAATRADFALAAAAVLTGEGHANQTYELAGDEPFTRAQLAEEISRRAGRTIPYRDLPEAEYEKILAGFLPPALARILADADAKAAEGALDDSSHTLSRLIGRRTTPLSEAIAVALR